MRPIFFKFMFFLTCILGFVFINFKANSQELFFNSWTKESGLSQNTVYAICEDKYGHIWLGTRNGLNRFDGKKFKIYHPSTKYKSITGENEIVSLLSDEEGVLWVGTNTGVLAYNVDTHNYIQVPLENNIYKFRVYHIYHDNESNIWLATDRGLFLLKKQKPFVFEKFGGWSSKLLKSSHVLSVFKEKNGTIWASSPTGLIRIKCVNNKWEQKIFKHNPTDPTSISSNVVTAINIDKEDNLWLGTQNEGLNLYNRKTEGFIRINKNTSPVSLISDNIREVNVDSAGNIWIGTQEGLSKLNWQKKTIHHYQNIPKSKYSLSQNSVHSIFIDHNQYVWVGTFFGGVNLINPFPSKFKVWQNDGTSNGLSNNVVSSIAADKVGNLWIGTEGGGLNYYNRETQQFTHFKQENSGLGSNLIKAVFKDADGNIWIGTHAGGLVLYQNGRFKKYLFKPNLRDFHWSEISAIAEDADNNLWIGQQGGIMGVEVYKRVGTELTEISEKYDRHPLNGRNIKKILLDSRKNIWIATSDGLFIVRNGKKVVEPFATDVLHSASNIAHITSIQEDSKGNIWFGVENIGLKRYNPVTQSVYGYHFKKSIPEHDVFGILEDSSGYIWLSTTHGLIKLNPETHYFQTYTKADGLPSNTFNYNAHYKDGNGNFYFGGYDGLVSFKPSSFLSNTTDAPIVFTSLKTLNQSNDVSITASETLKLHYNQNVFTINFALLNYIKPEKNKYVYRLLGFEKNWSKTNNPSVTYMNLKPGKYTLAVAGANSDGKWSSIKKLSIIVLPPFWKTWWAYLIYIVLAAVVIFLIVRFFYLKELIKQEEALHQNKLDFFTNITHEIRTHLTLIMSPVDKMIVESTNNPHLQQQLGGIKKNASNLLRLSEELMDFRKAETEHLKLKIAEHDIVLFVKEIYEHFTELSLAQEIQISFTYDILERLVYFDKEQMEKVFFNLISNAFKFTPNGGRISVHISESKRHIKVSVIDNGRGIAPAYKDKLFNNFFQANDSGLQNKGYGIGLAFSNKIATLHGAKIEVESFHSKETDKERKTTFTVLLKKGKEHFNELPEQAKASVNISDEKEKSSYTPIENIKRDNDVSQSYIKNKKLTILIVDDNPDIRNLIQDILADDYKVISKENASLGWEHAINHIPDLIISDVMMPDEDGFAFCYRLKSDTRTCHIPVILLTAKTTQQDHIDGLNRGADIYLTKPFNRTVLSLNVRNLLTTRERIRENVRQQVQNGLLQQPTADQKNDDSNNLDHAFLQELLGIIDTYLDDPAFNVTILSKKIGMSVPILYKKVKAVTGLSVNDFIKSIKLQKAAELLRQNNLAVYEVCYSVGYQDRKHFSAAFKKKFGKTPKQYSMSFNK